MASRVAFTTNLQRHVPCPTMEVTAGTVREALDAVFAANPRARGYVLDEHGGVRPHMAVFVDGRQVRDRTGLSDAVPPDAEIHVMQALSGG
jgi:sulfur-carrier protein